MGTGAIAFTCVLMPLTAGSLGFSVYNVLHLAAIQRTSIIIRASRITGKYYRQYKYEYKSTYFITLSMN